MLIDLVDELHNYNNITDSEVEKIRNQKMKKIFEIHQSLMNALGEIEDFFNVLNLIGITFIKIEIVASIFALIAIDWYLGIVFIGLFLFELFTLCIFGTGLEIMQEKLDEKINNIIWYDKSKSEKKNLLIILTSLNSRKSFTCIISNLNLAYFLDVSNSILNVFNLKPSNLHKFNLFSVFVRNLQFADDIDEILLNVNWFRIQSKQMISIFPWRKHLLIIMRHYDRNHNCF